MDEWIIIKEKYANIVYMIESKILLSLRETWYQARDIGWRLTT